MKSQLYTCLKFSFCISMEIHSVLVFLKKKQQKTGSVVLQDKTMFDRKKNWYVYLILFFPSMSYDCVCCPHEGVRYILAFSFTDYSTCGRVFVRLICGSSGKALFSSFMCFVSCSFLAIYSNICFTVSSG